MNVLDKVRRSCARVAEKAQHVRLAEERIAQYVDDLPNVFQLPALDAASHDVRGGASSAAYVLTLDAINFGSGYFAHLCPYMYEGQKFEGYFAVAAALKSLALREELTPKLLASLSTEDCGRIFAQNLEDPPMHELMEHFARALRELGEHLLQAYEGSFVTFIESAEASAQRLAEQLIEMSYFRDVIETEGEEIYFLKRAQLAAADLSLAFGAQGIGHFKDLHRLTIFADNQVPHVLHVDGLLEYTPELAARIAAREELPSGSREEIEIRACGVHAAELIVQTLQKNSRDVDAMHLDYFLWNRGEASQYKSRPAHVTRSRFY